MMNNSLCLNVIAITWCKTWQYYVVLLTTRPYVPNQEGSSVHLEITLEDYINCIPHKLVQTQVSCKSEYIDNHHTFFNGQQP